MSPLTFFNETYGNRTAPRIARIWTLGNVSTISGTTASSSAWPPPSARARDWWYRYHQIIALVTFGGVATSDTFQVHWGTRQVAILLPIFANAFLHPPVAAMTAASARSCTGTTVSAIWSTTLQSAGDWSLYLHYLRRRAYSENPSRTCPVSSNNVSSNNRQISKYFGFVQKPVCRAVCSAPHGTSVSQSVSIVCARRHLRARRPDNCFLWMFEV